MKDQKLPKGFKRINEQSSESQLHSESQAQRSKATATPSLGGDSLKPLNPSMCEPQTVGQSCQETPGTEHF